MPFWLEYPITKPFTLPYFTQGVIVAGVIWTAFVTVVNIAAVGYDTVSVTSFSFNSSQPLLWYEQIPLIASWFPKGCTCSPSTIMPGDSWFPKNIVADGQGSIRQNGSSSTNLLRWLTTYPTGR